MDHGVAAVHGLGDDDGVAQVAFDLPQGGIAAHGVQRLASRRGKGRGR